MDLSRIPFELLWDGPFEDGRYVTTVADQGPMKETMQR